MTHSRHWRVRFGGITLLSVMSVDAKKLVTLVDDDMERLSDSRVVAHSHQCHPGQAMRSIAQRWDPLSRCCGGPGSALTRRPGIRNPVWSLGAWGLVWNR